MLYKIIGFLAVLCSSMSVANTLYFDVAGKPSSSLTYDEMQALPVLTYHTRLPWLNEPAEFAGVPLAFVLDREFGSIPDRITLSALNDYSIQINKQDIEKYKPIIAYRKDGERIAIRDKGPFWVIYSLTDYPELDNITYHSQMIWQLERIKK